MPTIDSKLQQIYGIWALGALIPAASSLLGSLVQLLGFPVGIRKTSSSIGGREAV
jgi:hypothetical protein